MGAVDENIFLLGINLKLREKWGGGALEPRPLHSHPLGWRFPATERTIQYTVQYSTVPRENIGHRAVPVTQAIAQKPVRNGVNTVLQFLDDML